MKYALLLPVTGLLILSGSAEAVIRVANEAVESALPVQKEITLKGRILDENGKPLAGVSVIIAGESKGTVSGSEGNFSIKGNEGDVLVFSFVGKASQRLALRGDLKDLKITMRTVPTRLDGLVVVGYAQEEKGNKKAGEVKVSNAVENAVFVVVEEMPHFPGGDRELMSFLAKNVKYPVIEQERGVQGEVLVSFVVSREGKIRDQKIVRSVSAGLDKEALRVVGMMPDWTPGKQRGKAVDVMFTLPVNFRLATHNSSSSEVKKTGDTVETIIGTDGNSAVHVEELIKVLIVLDGREMPVGYDLKDINQDDIESITILKDPASIQVYGDRGKEGVILVTTKKK